MLILLAVVYVADSMPKQREPLAKKGARAWENAKQFRPTLVNRLLVHAVDDNTNKVYLKAVAAFLKEVKLHQVPFDNKPLRDRALARYLEDQCYINLANVANGANTFFGFLHCFEDHRQHMPEASRALKAWQRMAQSGEGGPMAKETVGAIAEHLLAKGRFMLAVIVLLSFDCFLREQDWEGLRCRDVAREPSGRMALLFGVRERGEKAKTGSNQGVVVDDEWVADLLQAMMHNLSQDERIFPMSAASFRREWWTALKDLDLELCGPPHNLRHAGAASFMESGGHIEMCRRRGRWLQVTSVQRYTKTHWLIRHRASVPKKFLDLGAAFWEKPWKFVPGAIAKSGIDSPLSRRLIEATNKARRQRRKRDTILKNASNDNEKIDDVAGDLGKNADYDFIETDRE